MEIKLKYPIPGKDGEGVVEVLRLRRLKAKDFKLLPKGEDADDPCAQFPLIAALADLPESSIEELDAEDLKAVGDGFEKKYEKFLETGDK